MNHPVVSRYFDTLKFDIDTMWCLDTSISIPFGPALAETNRRSTIQTRTTLGRTPVRSTHLLLLVEVDEGERKRDVERVVFERSRHPLSRLKNHHHVDPAGGTLAPERVDEIRSEDVRQQLLELQLDTWRQAAEPRDKRAVTMRLAAVGHLPSVMVLRCGHLG